MRTDPDAAHDAKSPHKRALKRGYKAIDGMADLYVYFYEQGLRLLKPGGRMSYVVTNRWLKAGYAEELRRLFSDDAWLEFVADFGHAKHFFPGADVFPSVVTVRKPLRGLPPPEDAAICVIPRDSVPRRGLEAAVKEATFPLPRAMFTKEAWVLEPRPVMDLLDKIRRKRVPLVKYAGVKPYRGVLTRTSSSRTSAAYRGTSSRRGGLPLMPVAAETQATPPT